MPVLSQTCSGGLTAQSVINSVATDLLQRIAPEDPVLLDYINRVQLQLLRVSRWKFLLSAPQRFVTRLSVTDYWIGTVGAAPLGTYDTGLGITNLGVIKSSTVFDRSNYRNLFKTDEAPNIQKLIFSDLTVRPGKPRLWRNAPDTPNILNLYPAPDNQNGIQPVPDAPAVSATATGGTVASGIYYIRVTLVDSLGGESATSTETKVYVPGNSGTIVIQPPEEIPTTDTGVAYDRWNVYASTSSNAEKLQNATPLANTAAQTISAPLTSTGASFPTANSLQKMGGYLIEFRYFKAKPQVVALTDCILIPADYFDVLTAGVNYFTAKYIQSQPDIEYWQQEWQRGITGMIRDKNLFPRGAEFIKPDPTSASQTLPSGIEVFDQSQFPLSGPE